ncbi:MAG: FAD-dependent oxidoreductase, partial [Candidatus Limnocylindrus sp.]
MARKEILIVGAGLVGSLLALLLARRGHKVRVIARRGDMRKQQMSAGRSINLALSHRGLRGLDAVGLRDEVLALALPMGGRMVHDEQGQQAFQPYGRAGQAIHSVSRRDLNVLLMNHAEGMPNVEFSFGRRCVEVDFDH